MTYPADWTELNRLQDQAAIRARVLRRQAIDSFWRDLGEVVHHAGRRLARPQRPERRGSGQTGTPRNGSGPAPQPH